MWGQRVCRGGGGLGSPARPIPVSYIPHRDLHTRPSQQVGQPLYNTSIIFVFICFISVFNTKTRRTSQVLSPVLPF